MRADTHTQVLIVGSGVAGGRVAAEVTAAGRECTVLEAGSPLPAEEGPLSEFEMIRRLYWYGGLELNTDGSIVFTRGRGVGGGSVVNQALLDELDETILCRWRERSGVDWLDERHLGPVYNRLLAELPNRVVPVDRRNRSSELVAAGAANLGWAMTPMRRAETDACDGQDCIGCLGGCPVGGKADSRVTTLTQALDRGATIVSDCSVSRIAEYPGGVRVHARVGGDRRSFTANALVVAGGAIGTTALLLASGLGRRIEALGTGFHCHPQWLTAMLVDERVEAATKAFGSLGSTDRRFEAAGFKLETNFTPPIVHHLLLSGWGREVHELSTHYHESVGIEILVRDDNPGRVSVRRDGSPVLHKRLDRTDRARQRRAVGLLGDLARELEASQLLVGPRPFSVHQMGGAGLSDSPERGAVDPDFRLHGSERVFVADSSLFPSATGRNPSLTIMALATLAAERVVAAT